ncbi:hypothetical protein [Arthrobacter sp. B0490]|uniref:hypothetical protein n=1 Tax=Arthrobacter sp. B0490 TaxID=2058891 RepID=UPI0011AFDFBB|nr:hypothetical protein [Arthrobacter sp. B0490]
MGIFTRFRRHPGQPAVPAASTAGTESQVLYLADSIAHSQARLLLTADRVAAGRAEPGDEARLRIQREITASFRKRLERIELPDCVGDDAEEWLRSTTTPPGTGARQLRPH